MTRIRTESAGDRIAYFISPHGYGHAARASAVMAAIHELDPSIQFEIFTLVPRWFFQNSLSMPFGYHSFLTDIGLVQKTSLVADIPETLKRLNNFLPFDPLQIRNLSEFIIELGCQSIVCDIAPLGIAVAREAGIPSFLIENFTWDWIYQEYSEYSEMTRFIAYLQELIDSADYHIQTEPICCHRDADLITSPVSRANKKSKKQIREMLRFRDTAKVVMITMGGMPWNYTFLKQLETLLDIHLIVPGAVERTQFRNNLVLLPHHSEFFHPDLVNASNVVVGKLGYSTLAEVYHAGAPFGYIPRRRFPESSILAAYIEKQMNGLEITEVEFQDGNWLSKLPELLAFPRTFNSGPNGAVQVATFICELSNQ